MDVPEWVAANAKFLSGHPETWKFLPTAGYPEVEEVSRRRPRKMEGGAG